MKRSNSNAARPASDAATSRMCLHQLSWCQPWSTFSSPPAVRRRCGWFHYDAPSGGLGYNVEDVRGVDHTIFVFAKNLGCWSQTREILYSFQSQIWPNLNCKWERFFWKMENLPSFWKIAVSCDIFIIVVIPFSVHLLGQEVSSTFPSSWYHFCE